MCIYEISIIYIIFAVLDGTSMLHNCIPAMDPPVVLSSFMCVGLVHFHSARLCEHLEGGGGGGGGLAHYRKECVCSRGKKGKELRLWEINV